MDLLAKLFLGETANWLKHVLGESLIDLFLVIVDSGLRILQVLDVV